MSDAGAWRRKLEKVVEASGDPRVEVGAFARPGDGAWSVRFATDLGDWSVVGSARLGLDGLQIESLHVDFNPLAPPDPSQWSKGGSGPARVSPTSGISSGVLKKIPLALIKDAIQRRAVTQPEFDRLFSALGPDHRVPKKRKRSNRKLATIASEAGIKGTGRPRLGSDHFRSFAIEAIRLDAEGVRPLRAELALRYSRDANTIRDWLHRARNEGWLAPAARGQRGVFPGRRLLAEGEEANG